MTDFILAFLFPDFAKSLREKFLPKQPAVKARKVEKEIQKKIAKQIALSHHNISRVSTLLGFSHSTLYGWMRVTLLFWCQVVVHVILFIAEERNYLIPMTI